MNDQQTDSSAKTGIPKNSSKRLLSVVASVLLVLAGCIFAAYQIRRHAERVDELKDIVYVGTKPERFHLLDLYIPRGIKGPLPLMVFVHGGGWEMGSKDICPCLETAQHGYVCASVNYRYSMEGKYPAQIHDVKAAIRWLKAHAAEYNIDPTRVGCWGISAGGHLVALLGTTKDAKELEGNLGNLDQSSSVQAVIDWCGPSDLTTITEQAGNDNELKLGDPDGCVGKLLGGLPKDKAELAKAASPVTYIDSTDAPVLLVHGDKDTVVPFAQSTEFYDKLQAANVPSRLIKIKGAGHQVFSRELVELTWQFLDKYLKN